jgi:hypothetical protein
MLDAIKEKMLAKLKDIGPLRATALIELAQTSRPSGYRALAALVDEGKVYKPRAGRVYALCERSHDVETTWLYGHLRGHPSVLHTVRSIGEAFRKANKYPWPEELIEIMLRDAEKAGLVEIVPVRGQDAYRVRAHVKPVMLADLLS